MQHNPETLHVELKGYETRLSFAMHERAIVNNLLTAVRELIDYCRARQPTIEFSIQAVPEPPTQPTTWLEAKAAKFRAVLFPFPQRLQTISIVVVLEALRDHLAQRQSDLSSEIGGLKHDMAVIRETFDEERDTVRSN